ncbi:probable protein S-acyltransferase 7 isoform X3 [Hevea brasiliensis]|uniref:probable protein S-acyltransferase 7 isoform X3 n=1 Tax=Hevea brasiliensis TaxID=3981 RepID=UPI0025FBF740|nr:probable protein S-acyltransferase 7 isoform X3 [Hevea brasiliensis]
MGTVDGMRGKMYTAPMPPPPPAHRHISGSDRRIIDSNGPDLRVYQAWKGSNLLCFCFDQALAQVILQRIPYTRDKTTLSCIFCFGGRLIFGPDVRSLFLTVFMIVTPAILFCTFVSHELINEFQHHLGNLIEVICAISTAYRNYRFFFMFVSSTTMLCLYVFAFCWVNVRKIMGAYDCNLWRSFLKSPISGILILYTFVCVWFVGGLTAFHLYLICTNQTTYENFRYRYDGKTNPYNLGYVRNIIEVFFTKIPKSKNSFREKIKVNSYSIYATSMSLGQSLSPEIPKTSFDVEVGKRQAVADEDFEEIQSHIDNVGGLERCGTQPRHINRDHKANWEITPDIRILAAELESGHGLRDRQKISRDH